MDTVIKDNIKQYWDKNALDYDKQFGHGINNSLEKKLWFDLIMENINFPSGAAVLDVGCGTGFLSLLLAEQGHQVTGIDLSDKMLKVAEEKSKRHKLNIYFKKGDAENPCFNPGSFDVIISRHVVWTLPEPHKAIKNWFQLLKPNGIVIIIDGLWSPKTLIDHMAGLLSNMIMVIKGNLRHLFWKKKYIPNLKDLPFFGGTTPKNIELLLSSNGFNNIWKDDMTQIIDYEKIHAPVEYKIRSFKKNRRYLIGGKKNEK